ncbi:MAG: hypothetical protein EPO68_11685 [Planctomycetota bacterium]|nr:MAG: hypothetical protein EPO68_11685 [Planctomycetota bacterium]
MQPPMLGHVALVAGWTIWTASACSRVPLPKGAPPQSASAPVRVEETFRGGVEGQFFGAALASGHDVDGDGVVDLAIGSFNHLRLMENGPFGVLADHREGSITLLSLREGRVLWQHPSSSRTPLLGNHISMHQDIDGDGRADVVAVSMDVSAVAMAMGSSVGTVTALRGTTGDVIWERDNPVPDSMFHGEHAVIPDQNGDGLDDLALAVELLKDPNDAALLLVVDAKTGRRIEGRDVALPCGPDALRVVSDLDGDARAELLVGLPDATVGAMRSAGIVLAISGATGRELHRWSGDAAGLLFGSCVELVAGVGAGSGADLLVGARGDKTCGSYCGRAQLLDRTTGAEARRIGGAARSEFGTGSCVLGDIDSDGSTDVWIGAARGSREDPRQPWGIAVSMRSGAELLYGRHSAAAALGDIDRDGRADFALADPRAFDGAGVVQLYLSAAVRAAESKPLSSPDR